MVAFTYLGFKSIRNQKGYISRLGTIFLYEDESKNIEDSDSSSNSTDSLSSTSRRFL